MTFLEDVLNDLKQKDLDFSEVIFILPSRRAGVFLRHYLPNYIEKTTFAPEIISIEDFVQNLSGLRQLNNVELLFQFYKSYEALTPKDETESFESFSNWAQIVLQDFNEIDRYLVDPDAIFDYLSAIKELDHWSNSHNQTELVSSYVKFWKRLKQYYFHFTNNLLQDNLGYQGLIYREALNNIESYIQNSAKQHIFIGFNALNKSEEHIIQELLHNDRAVIFWDIDKAFIQDNLHSAGYFMSNYKTKWPYFSSNQFHWISSNYNEQKSIKVIGCPKSVGQSKCVGTLLKNLSKERTNFNNTAVVLGDESMLMPLLSSLPISVNSLNVTMGFPLKSIPLASLFEQLFKIHKTDKAQFYFKDVLNILSHQMIQPLIKSNRDLMQTIQDNNIVHLPLETLKKVAASTDLKLMSLLFEDWHSSIETTLKKCIALIHHIKDVFKNSYKNTLELEYLYRFYKLFNELELLNTRHSYIRDVNSLHKVYKELLSMETLDFQGEPLDGLQVMGMLESRVLDFETVIITSVNEGILPAGKTDNSFIPFDVKLQHNLPTFRDKDTVYSYHFFRLLQRAKSIYIIYNTEMDALKGGEKSRFITQLEVEGIHTIAHEIMAPEIPKLNPNLLEIHKDNSILDRLKAIAAKGFSPSALTNYIRNPIDFYFDKVLGIKDIEDVEETIAANTLGSVIHGVLQDFYEPLVGAFLLPEHLDSMQPKIDSRIAYHFKTFFRKGNINQGKNLIIYEIAKRYILNFIRLEKEQLTKNHTIKIIAIEAKVESEINIPELNFPVKLKGEIDRVDEFDGVTRIIDYKSGKVLQHNLEIIDWNNITKDYKAYSKAFQVLMYAYMLSQEHNIQLPVEAGIISFKNLRQGFLKFAKKESSRGRKDTRVAHETLNAFEKELKNIIVEICNPSLKFIEKQID